MNPPSLFAAAPAEQVGVDTSATLVRRIKAEPTSFNPILMYTAIDAGFDYLLWDRPFVLDERLELMLNPAMVERFEEDADRLSAVLVLKPRLEWQDGAPLTADDIAFSWRCINDERVVCRRARTAAEQLADCTVVNPRTVRFKFWSVLPTNRWAVDFPILPQHVYARLQNEDATLERSTANVERNRNPIGNGPYRLVEWKSGERIVLERWPGYKGPRPAMRRLVFRIVPDNNAALLAFEAGELDEMELTPQQFALETNDAAFAGAGVKAKAEQWTNYYIGWNCAADSPYFADVRVRQAMCHALNLDRMIQRVFYGLFTPSCGLFHRDFWASPSDASPHEFDLGEAARLLDAAGWRIDPADGWRYRTGNGDNGGDDRLRLSFTLNLVLGSQTSPKVAEILQSDLARIGVEMKTEVLDWSVFSERNFRHEFDAYLSAWTPGPEPDELWNLFHSTARDGGRNYVSYANPRVDELLELGRRTTSFESRQACYREFARIIGVDAPYTFLVNAPTLWAFDKRLRGVRLSPRGPCCFYPGVLSWWMPAGN